MSVLNAVSYAIESLLAICFVSAGMGKLRDPLRFEGSLRRIPLLPRAAVKTVSLALPIVEVTAGSLLIFNVQTLFVALGLALLVAVLSVPLVMLLRQGVSYECLCFGAAAPRLVTWRTVARNLLLIMGALLVAWSSTTDGPGRMSQDGILAGAAVTALTGLLLFTGWSLAAEASAAARGRRQVSDRLGRPRAHA